MEIQDFFWGGLKVCDVTYMICSHSMSTETIPNDPSFLAPLCVLQGQNDTWQKRSYALHQAEAFLPTSEIQNDTYFIEIGRMIPMTSIFFRGLNEPLSHKVVEKAVWAWPWYECCFAFQSVTDWSKLQYLSMWPIW